MNRDIFRSYDIRGVYPKDLDEKAAKFIAQTFLRVVSHQMNKPIKDLKICIGRDIRQSSLPIKEAIMSVFMEYGVEVDYYGLMSINDFYFANGYYKYDGGMMITASHNPPEYGGFKMTYIDPETRDNIRFIGGKELLEEMEKIKFPIKDPKSKGKINKKEIIEEHIKHILSFVDYRKLKDFKVVVDTGNGMNGLLIPGLFYQMPPKLVHIFKDLDGSFPNRPPNPLVDGAADKLTEKVLKEKANLGVIFDVDGDRMFLVDEKGNFITGDMILLLLAKPMLERFPGMGIAYNVVCSHAVKDLVAKWGGQPIRSEVGYRNLARHMREQGGIMSGEVSAHFAFRDNYYADNAFIALILVLQTMTEDGRPLSEIIKEYRLYVRGDEINIEVADIEASLEKIRQNYGANILDEMDGITVEFEDWWFNVRASNTEPLLRITVEANAEAELKNHQKEILDILNN
ncbi:phosphomannomutase/phosphoglucomutase [Candidatus Parcubacteria bacterium]|jgi:phosphomannomutase|nr:phosphomannomutase/phosphoglucomutase [Candidatus Parcubacteria bacterium]MBT7228305.1 phosphomannomutase/phosphoglucomutase [Candidatus Parcubacteria bacterium]